MVEMKDDPIKTYYFLLKKVLPKIVSKLFPYFRRAIRFFALPYLFFKMIDWETCTKPRIQVIKDLFYIFFWMKCFPNNYGYCRLWEKDRQEWIYYYGSNYDAYQRYRLSIEVQKPEYDIIFEDKELCHHLCQGYGLTVPRCYGVLDPHEDYHAKLKSLLEEAQVPQLICKPTTGSAGRDIFLALNKADQIIIRTQNDEMDLSQLVLNQRFIVQDVVKLHDKLHELSPSISIRILTLYTLDGEVTVLTAELLMGIHNNFLSNWSAGGLCIGVDIHNGCLHSTAYDKFGRKYSEHPTSKIRFEDFVIPDWPTLKAFAVKIQNSFPYYRMVGPDIALTKDGPILYEINARPDLASTEQTCGPLLKDWRVLREFGKYDLLYNKHQRDLAKKLNESLPST